MPEMEATIAQPAVDPTPNQSSTLVPGMLLPLVVVHKTENPYSNQLITMVHQAVDSIPDQHSMVTGVTLPMDKSPCNHQVKLPQEETTPHTGQYVIFHGNYQKLS